MLTRSKYGMIYSEALQHALHKTFVLIVEIAHLLFDIGYCVCFRYQIDITEILLTVALNASSLTLTLFREEVTF